MFQLDRGDLDFGLYRIMNMKAAEIETFLDRDLPPRVKIEPALNTDEERAAVEEALETARRQARALGYAPDAHPSDKMIAPSARLAEFRKDAEAEACNHLADSFGRYCTEGNFVSRRRHPDPTGDCRPRYPAFLAKGGASGFRMRDGLLGANRLSRLGGVPRCRRSAYRHRSSFPVSKAAAWRRRLMAGW